MSAAFLFAVTIDVECDKDVHWNVRQPLSFRGVREGIGAVLQPLFEEYGARPTYLLSPEVLRDTESMGLLASLANCELGTHLHREFLSGSAGVANTLTVSSLGPAEQERDDLRSLTELFAAVVGMPPVSFRAGRFGAAARTARFLEEFGYQVDTSVTPFKKWEYGPDFEGAPAQPYFPADGDLGSCGSSRRLLEVPVTIRRSAAPAWLRDASALAARAHVPCSARLAKWSRGPWWFRPGWSSEARLLGFVADAARAQGSVLNMMFHNVDVVEGLSMNARSPEMVRCTLGGVRVALRAARDAGGRFVTLTELRDQWLRRGS